MSDRLAQQEQLLGSCTALGHAIGNLCEAKETEKLVNRGIGWPGAVEAKTSCGGKAPLPCLPAVRIAVLAQRELSQVRVEIADIYRGISKADEIEIDEVNYRSVDQQMILVEIAVDRPQRYRFGARRVPPGSAAQRL